MSFKSLSIVATAALALFAGAAQAANAFDNAGFEGGQTSLPSNSGPVPNVNAAKAQSWLSFQNGYDRSGDAHSGSFSALVHQTAMDQAGVMQQNSKAHGYMPDLTVGESLTLSFWAKASVAEAVSFYNFTYKFSFLDDTGNILGGSSPTNFATQTNTAGWSLISPGTFVVPAGATAAFLEFSVAGGGRLAAVLIDDVSLAGPVTAVPEPESYALMLAGLGVVGSIVRRRRRSV